MGKHFQKVRVTKLDFLRVTLGWTKKCPHPCKYHVRDGNIKDENAFFVGVKKYVQFIYLFWYSFFVIFLLQEHQFGFSTNWFKFRSIGSSWSKICKRAGQKKRKWWMLVFSRWDNIDSFSSSNMWIMTRQKFRMFATAHHDHHLKNEIQSHWMSFYMLSAGHVTQ